MLQLRNAAEKVGKCQIKKDPLSHARGSEFHVACHGGDTTSDTILKDHSGEQHE